MFPQQFVVIHRNIYISPTPILQYMKMRFIMPYATMSQVIELLEKMYPKNMSERELSVFTGISASSISNITPTAVLLKLIEKKKNKLLFTEEGLNFMKALKTNNEEKMREIIKKNIKGNEIFDFVINLLQKYEILKNQEIGEKLSIKFNKNWSHPLTFARYGTCVSDIVAFAGYGYYSNGILSLKEIRKKERFVRLSIPEVNIRKIKKICNKLRVNNKSLGELSEELKTREKRLVTELTNCVTLGLITREKNVYFLSKRGNDFVNPMITEDEKKNIFRKCLLESEYSKIIYRFVKLKQEFQTSDIGDFLAYELKREWSESTKRTITRKFVDWLIYGKIINRTERGHYEIDRELLEEIGESLEKEEITTEEEKSKFIRQKERAYIETSKVFEIGKLLERTKIKIEHKINIENEILELISLCNSVSQLEDIADLIKSHYELYKENKDPRVLTPDLNLIDKILGGE